MTPSNSGAENQMANCSTFAHMIVHYRCRRGVSMLHQHEYPQPQAFSRSPREFDKPVQVKRILLADET